MNCFERVTNWAHRPNSVYDNSHAGVNVYVLQNIFCNGKSLRMKKKTTMKMTTKKEKKMKTKVEEDEKD